MSIELNETERQTLLAFARARIDAHLTGAHPPGPPRGGAFDHRAGAFVTLHEREDGRLRGCIGQIEAVTSVADAVSETAVSSAVRDPRFPPLQPEELSGVRIEISVLSPLHTITGADEIEPGRHGLLISRRGRSGLLLPQVASERGWDTQTFLTQTCFKAGMSGDCWRDSETTIQVFTAQVFSET